MGALLGHLTQHRFGLFTSCPPLAYSLLTLLPLCTLGVRSRKSLAWAGATGRVSAGLIGGPTLCWCLEHVSCTLAWTILCVRRHCASGAWLLRRVKLEALAATALATHEQDRILCEACAA